MSVEGLTEFACAKCGISISLPDISREGLKHALSIHGNGHGVLDAGGTRAEAQMVCWKLGVVGMPSIGGATYSTHERWLVFGQYCAAVPNDSFYPGNYPWPNG